MKQRLTMALAAGALVAAMVPGVASADVTVITDGLISVGKGDVQQALGWNDAELQAGGGDLSFRRVYREQLTRTWTCTNELGVVVANGSRTYVAVIRTTRYTTVEVVNPRDRIVGFDLERTSEIRQVGDFIVACPGETVLDASEVPAGTTDVLDVSVPGGPTNVVVASFI